MYMPNGIVLSVRESAERCADRYSAALGLEVDLWRELADKSIHKLLGQNLVTEIERFCLQVENEMHLYLWFVGD